MAHQSARGMPAAALSLSVLGRLPAAQRRRDFAVRQAPPAKPEGGAGGMHRTREGRYLREADA